MGNGLPLVTGALGYTGRYIAQELLKRHLEVRSMTNSPARRNPFGPRLRLDAYRFDDAATLARSLSGVDTLYNTYWVRFDGGSVTFRRAIENTKILLEAAASAGVRRIVHVSVTNADPGSELPYFRGKGEVERLVRNSGLSYAIVRPALIYGPEELLLNNVAWLLRRVPVFLMPGDGDYPIQPIAATELASMLVEAGERTGDEEFDAVEQEVLTFEEIVRLLGTAVRKTRPILHVPPRVSLVATRVVGWFLRDIVLTGDELAGLRQQLLRSRAVPTATGSFRHWVLNSGAELGRRYLSELKLHFSGRAVYRSGWGGTEEG